MQSDRRVAPRHPARGDPHPAARPGTGKARAVMFLLLLILPLACSDDDPHRPSIDITPPRSIANLTARALDHTSVRLTWTAPGDDDSTGTAARYDLRYSTEPFPAGGHWPTWFPTVDTLPAPASAGTTQTVTIPRLLPDTRYYFGLRARDEAGNWSLRSNVASATTFEAPPPPDLIPPEPVTDLTRDASTSSVLRLRWTAPADQGPTGSATAYDIRWRYGPLTEETWTQAIPVAAPPLPRTADEPETFEIPGIEFGRPFQIGLKSRDAAGNDSPLSNVVSAALNAHRVFHIRPDGTGDAPTIQAGIDSAATGDTVLVEPGVYHEVIRFGDRDIIVRGEASLEETTIDGTGLGNSVVQFPYPVTRAAILEQMTVTGGSGSPDFSPDFPLGGGIWTCDASPTIRGLRVVGNHVTGVFGTGGGIEVGGRHGGGWPLIEDCLIEGNISSTANGGGIAVEGSSVTIQRCQVVRNSCKSDGGGIWIWGAFSESSRFLTARLSITERGIMGEASTMGLEQPIPLPGSRGI